MISYQNSNSSPYRFRNAFYALTVVRLILFVGRIIGRAFHLFGQLSFKLLRIGGLFFIDLFYGLKVKLVDLKYSGRREQTRFNVFFSFIATIIGQTLAALFQLFRRSGRVAREGATRTRAGIYTEVQSYKQVRIAKKPSLVWSTVNFCLILCALMLPFLGYAEWRRIEPLRQRILSSTASAVENLFTARDQLSKQDLPAAQNAFGEASKNFLTARQQLSSINSFLLSAAAVIPNDTFRLAASSRHVLAAGELSSRLGEHVSAAMTVPPGTEATTVHFLENFITQGEQALPLARDLEKELSKIDADALPEQYQTQFKDLKDKAVFLSQSLEEALSVARELERFLGKQMDKRYMLVFQNNAEKRASGGFIGSFALVDVRRGEIVALTVPKGGSYDTEAGLSRIVAAPEPLRLLNPLWHFWDANWWPDWPTSARKLMQFYEESNGPTVDGVISLTPTVMERLLRVIGPIDMTADYGVIITADNFWSVTQTFSEQKPDKTKEPKRIIGDLMNRIIAEAPARLTPDKTIELVSALEESLNQKDILAYMTDPDLQRSVENFGWGGTMATTNGDYLMVVDTNIGGQKTDRVIDEHIEHHAEILPDGSIIDTLTIRRTHNGIKNELFTGVRNVNWMRIYVPQGSTLISASGFSLLNPELLEEPEPGWDTDPELRAEASARVDKETGLKIYDERAKTVFANWVLLDPGETATITVQYRLPFSLPVSNGQAGTGDGFFNFLRNRGSSTYSLLVQKQPGAQRSILHTSLNGIGIRQIAWQHPQDMTVTEGGWDQTQPFTTDFFTALLFKQ